MRCVDVGWPLGRRAASSSATDRPARARWSASAAPAHRAPTTMTSYAISGPLHAAGCMDGVADQFPDRDTEAVARQPRPRSDDQEPRIGVVELSVRGDGLEALRLDQGRDARVVPRAKLRMALERDVEGRSHGKATDGDAHRHTRVLPNVARLDAVPERRDVELTVDGHVQHA